jgi:hypothetical protein
MKSGVHWDYKKKNESNFGRLRVLNREGFEGIKRIGNHMPFREFIGPDITEGSGLPEQRGGKHDIYTGRIVIALLG